jgi:hypothetical protein
MHFEIITNSPFSSPISNTPQLSSSHGIPFPFPACPPPQPITRFPRVRRMISPSPASHFDKISSSPGLAFPLATRPPSRI